MSIARCIPGLVAEGKLTPDQAKRAEAIYGERQRHHQRSMGGPAADALASAETVDAMAAQAARTRRLEVLTFAARRDRLADMARYDGGAGGPLSPGAAKALIDHDGKAPFLNVEALRKAIEGAAMGEVDGILAQHRKTIRGKLRNPAEMDEIGRALFGEAVDSLSATELADALGRTFEMLRKRFNQAGGAIGKLAKWAPQSHDWRSVRNAGFNAWREFIAPRLDRARMVDDATGLPFTDEGLDAVLKDVFETIRTDGAADMSPGAAGQKSLANRRGEHRFLHFASYDDWAAYQAKFGSGSLFDAAMGHIKAMARDTAAMEVLGPNPDATLRWIKDSVAKHAALFGDDAGRAVDAAHAGGKQLDRLWDEYRGALRRPENRRLALGFGMVRSVQTSAKLGAAFLSSTSDFGFQYTTRKFNGLPAAGMIADYVKLMNPANEADRRFAVRRGLLAGEWSSMVAAQNRFLAEELTGEKASRMAEGVLRASGLAAHTDAQKWMFGNEFLDTLQGQFGVPWNRIEPDLRRALERYGFDGDQWDVIRASPLSLEHRGEQWFRPQDVADKRLGDRLLAMILTETDYAVPVADLRTRALMNSVAPKGTIAGEIIRSAFLFKSFGISVALSHGRRALEQPGWSGRLGYAASLMIPLMIGGAIAVQLKEIARGKDPRPMADPEFAGAAILQGGGFGIFGDFFGSAESRFGQGLAETAAGPLFQTAQNVGNLTIGNTARALRGDKTRVGKDFMTLWRQELPGGSLWYGRLAFDRVVSDQMQMLIDPNYRDSWRRMQSRARDRGQEFFWAPGELAPSQAPDLTTALEGAPQ